MYLAKDLLKLEIYHETAFENSCFVIDFQNKEAHYNPSSKSKIEDKILLSEESINNFLHSADEMDFIGQLQDNECHTLKYFEQQEDEYYFHTLRMILHHHILFSNQYGFVFYFKDFNKEYFVQWNYPDSWFDFSNILTDLVDFDVLDANNSKKWINNLDYDIRKDGIYGNSKKLLLKRFEFEYCVPHIIVDHRDSSFMIDFDKRRLSSEDRVFDEDFSQDTLNSFLELLVKYEIFLWENEKYWKNVYDSPTIWCDGYHWSIRLTFDNESVFYIGSHCIHPDSYFSFAEDVKNLFGEDLLRLKDCCIPDSMAL